METKKDIQKELSKTLHALDNWQQIKADPFFYTRLSVRIENKQSIFTRLLNLPIVKPALIALTLLINILTISYLTTLTTDAQNNDFANAFAQEYMLDLSTESYLVLNEE